MAREGAYEGRAEREFLFTPNDFKRVRKLLYDHAGISLSDSKQELVYSRLSRRLRSMGLQSFAEYIQLLEEGNGGEMESFINSMTTNLTSFFREEHHFPILAELLQSCKEAGKGNVALWCSAASTGEEAYSMAITAAQVFGTLSPPVSIIATDLDTRVLEVAREGVYPEDRVAKLDKDLVKQFFMRGTGKQEGFVRIRRELRDTIVFRQLNLLDAKWPLSPFFDAIFCRNVMIYFDKPTQLAILKKFAPLLHADGLLFAGHSESFYHADEYFKLRGKTVYQLSNNIITQRKAEKPEIM